MSSRRVIRAHEPGDESFTVYKRQELENYQAKVDEPAPGIGEVATYWQPQAFRWFGMKDQGTSRGKSPIISVNQTCIRLTVQAVALLDLKQVDKLSIGINKKFLAFRKHEAGFNWYPDKKSGAINISCRRLHESLAQEGWPVPCRMPAIWDEKNKMLVGKKTEM
jgi:hypothetical protein